MSCNCEKETTQVCDQDGVLLSSLTELGELNDESRIYVENAAIGDCEFTGYFAKMSTLADYVNLTPFGAVMPIWNATSDQGCWLLADGRTVTYQNDSNLTIENIVLPDLRGRVIVMPDAADALQTGVTNINIKTGWAKSQLQIEQMPSHGHGVTDPGHRHTQGDKTVDQNKDGVEEVVADDTTLDEWTTDTATTGISINVTGGGETHNNMQPSYGMNLFVYGCRPGWTITNINTPAALIPLTIAAFNENSLNDPNA